MFDVMYFGPFPLTSLADGSEPYVWKFACTRKTETYDCERARDDSYRASVHGLHQHGLSGIILRPCKASM